MDLSRSLVKKFSQSVTSSDSPSVETYIRGTLKVVGDRKFVQLDGSEQLTPVSEVTDAQDGDRVLVTIEKHTATVVGNYTYPPSARTANESLEKADNAKGSADEASAKAEAATTSATEAKALATESQNASQEAKTLATSAAESASKSQQLAEEAKTAVSEATVEIEAINSELIVVKNDIGSARTDLNSKITTINENLVANYATKSEVSTVEGNLTAEISKSAATLQTTISENYVAKSELVEIQSNIQTQITQNSESISSSATKIESLETDTAEIQNKVNEAKTAADNAKTAADKAQTDATAAKTAADEAQRTANEADEALKIANNNLSEAKANLESLTSRVGTTEEEISAAQQAVNEAQTSVNKAQADATAAKTAADNAKTAADKAQTDATNAKTAADKAQSDLDGVKSRVTTVETKAEQTAEKFNWLVKSGTSATNFTLTDRVAELTAQHINLNGLVTFSGFDTDTQNRITKVENWSSSSDATMIDGGKIYTNSITSDKISVSSLEAICAKIGGFTISDSAIYNGTSSITSTKAGVYIGTNGIRNYKNSSTFVNISNGVLTAKAANISGTITADELIAVDSISIYDTMNDTTIVLAKADGGVTFPSESWFESSVDFSGEVTFRSGISANGTVNIGTELAPFNCIRVHGMFIGADDYSSRTGYIHAYWKDGSRHNIVVRETDGLTASFGWAGSSTYKTISKIRGQTVQYQNASGTTTLSDERLKKDFSDLERWESFYMSLEPTAFKYINGSSGRYHTGFIAQQVQKALEKNGLTTNDFGGFVSYTVDPDDEDSWNGYETEHSLIYTEFTALNTYMTQKNTKRIDALQAQLEEAMAIIISQKKEIDNLKSAS